MLLSLSEPTNQIPNNIAFQVFEVRKEGCDQNPAPLFEYVFDLPHSYFISFPYVMNHPELF